LFYTTVSTPSASDWQTWATYTNTSNQPVLNNTYFTFADVVLPAATYYFAYTASNEKTSTPLSPISTGFTWAPVGMSGASGASGASGYSGFSGLSGYSGTGSTGQNGLAAITAYKLQSQTLTPPTYSTPTSGATAPSGWSLTAPTATVGQVVWYLMGQYNSNSVSYGGVPANSTAWTGPVAASVFQDIESDNWNGGTPPTTGPFSPLGTSGYYIQQSTGNMYLNSIYGRGVAEFDGANVGVSGYSTAILANISLGQSTGVEAHTNNTFLTSGAVRAYNTSGGAGNAVYGYQNGTGVGILGQSASGVGVEGTGNTGVYGVGTNGVYGVGTTGVIAQTNAAAYGLEVFGNMYIDNTNLVSNLNAGLWSGFQVTGFVGTSGRTLAGFIQVSYSGSTYYLPYYI
jgi:hypothetical protein